MPTNPPPWRREFPSEAFPGWSHHQWLQGHGSAKAAGINAKKMAEEVKAIVNDAVGDVMAKGRCCPPAERLKQPRSFAHFLKRGTYERAKGDAAHFISCVIPILSIRVISPGKPTIISGKQQQFFGATQRDNDPAHSPPTSTVSPRNAHPRVLLRACHPAAETAAELQPGNRVPS